MIKKLTVLAFVLFPIVAIIANHDVVTSVIGILWLLVILPACILLLIDWFRYNRNKSTASFIGKTLLRLPIAIFGAISTLLGSAIIIWILYNVFIERLSEYTGPSTIIGGFGIGPSLICFGFYLIHLSLKRNNLDSDQEIITTPKT